MDEILSSKVSLLLKRQNNSTSIRVNLLPRDLQVEFDGPQVINVHSHHLRHGSEQLLCLTDHAAHQHVSGQALQLCHLIEDLFTTHENRKQYE